MNRSFQAAWVLALATGAHVVPAVGQEMPAGPGEPGARAPGGRLERVEILGKQPADNELRRRAQIAKQVYGREELDRHGDTNIADVLQRLPGVTMQGNQPRMRGLGSGYTLVLINGDPAPPGFALDQLDPAQVERIEVTKGPVASQSAQAVAGAINIILKEAPKSSQRDVRLGMGYNADRPTLAGTFTFGEKWAGFNLSVPLSLFEWRGRYATAIAREGLGSDGTYASAQQSGDWSYFGHGFNLTPRLNWKISDDESVTWQTFLQRGQWNNRSVYTSQVLAGSPSLDDDGTMAGTWQIARSNVQWVNHLSAEERLEIKGGVSSSQGTFDVQGVGVTQPARRTLGDNTDLSLTQGGNYSHLVNEAHSLSVGWDLEWRERNEKRSVTVQGLPQTADFEGQPFSARIQRQAFYVQDEWEINKQWSTYLGLRSERIATSSQGAGDAATNTSSVTTPMWHLNYKLDAAGKDLIRASITRSYKAPDLGALLARPSVNALYADTSKANTELAPDRIGNPTLRPELATGLDLAFEKYLPAGGLFSVGVFYRQVSDLVRSVTTLQTVSWAGVPRWVSQPVNFSVAQTSGLEFELKGRAGELLPGWVDAKLPLNLRASLNVYQSRVDALPGPNNRLDGQQPWSSTLGADYRLSGVPVTMGGTLAFTPGYTTQQTLSQWQDQSRSRSLDLYAQWVLSRSVTARLALGNVQPVASGSRVFVGDSSSVETLRTGRTNLNLGVEIKL
ncbi:MAG: TonB-dependent receptor [Rhodoferax sp.]